MTTPPIDLEMLRRRTLGDQELLTELVGLFRTHTPAIWARLASAVRGNDIAAAVPAAHRMRGSAATIAASRLTDLLVALEAVLPQGDAPAASTHLAEIDAELTRCLSIIDGILPKLRSPLRPTTET